MAKNNSNKIGLGSILAVIGLVGLAVLFFLGQYYGGATFGASLILSAVLTVAFIVLLLFLRWTRSKENDLMQWRIIEGIAFAVYLVAVVMTAGISSRYVSVYGERKVLQAAAETDLNAITAEVSRFQSDEKSALGSTCTDLESLLNSGTSYSNYSPDLKEWFRTNRIVPDEQTFKSYHIDTFKDHWTRRLNNVTDADQNNNAEAWQHEVDDIRRDVRNFSVFNVPSAAKRLTVLNATVGATLDGISANLPFVSMERSGSGFGITGQHEPFRYHATVTMTEKLKGISDYSTAGLGLTVLLHILVLIAYVTTPYARSIRRPVTADDGGTVI